MTSEPAPGEPASGEPASSEPASSGRVLAYGAAALLVELDDPTAVGPLTAAILADDQLASIVDVVPAARTVLVRVGDPRRGAAPAALASVRARLHEVLAHVDTTAGVHGSTTADAVSVPVRYDGDDLDDVADRVGLRVPELVELHSSLTFVAAFCGFTAGFCYLTGLPQQLVLPRRASPRPRVPANTVAIADIYCGVYPSATPGGWNLLGTTAVDVWDVRRQPPNLVAPGQSVRFVPVVDR